MRFAAVWEERENPRLGCHCEGRGLRITFNDNAVTNNTKTLHLLIR